MTSKGDKDYFTYAPVSNGRLILEAGSWIILCSILWAIDGYLQITHWEQLNLGINYQQFYMHQITSMISVLIIIPLFYRLLRRFPFRDTNLSTLMIAYVSGWLVFAFLHYNFIVVTRIIIWPIFGESYEFSNYGSNLLKETLRDFKIYAGLLAVSHLLLYLRIRFPAPAISAPQLLIQTGRGQRWIFEKSIVYLASARNYVEVHTDEGEYLLRTTMEKILSELKLSCFIRVHRRFAVNKEKPFIYERLKDGKKQLRIGELILPVSRSYQADVQEAWKTSLSS